MAKKTSKHPPKLENVLELAQEYWDAGTYIILKHAIHRQEERAIVEPEIGWIIRHGYHEKKKDMFQPEYNSWNYAIRGKTIEERDIRIVVSWDTSDVEMLVITVIDLGEKKDT